VFLGHRVAFRPREQLPPTQVVVKGLDRRLKGNKRLR
jgi:hypothetical protein